MINKLSVYLETLSTREDLQQFSEDIIITIIYFLYFNPKGRKHKKEKNNFLSQIQNINSNLVIIKEKNNKIYNCLSNGTKKWDFIKKINEIKPQTQLEKNTISIIKAGALTDNNAYDNAQEILTSLNWENIPEGRIKNFIYQYSILILLCIYHDTKEYKKAHYYVNTDKIDFCEESFINTKALYVFGTILLENKEIQNAIKSFNRSIEILQKITPGSILIYKSFEKLSKLQAQKQYSKQSYTNEYGYNLHRI
jgi:hypothetical protein